MLASLRTYVQSSILIKLAFCIIGSGLLVGLIAVGVRLAFNHAERIANMQARIEAIAAPLWPYLLAAESPAELDTLLYSLTQDPEIEAAALSRPDAAPAVAGAPLTRADMRLEREVEGVPWTLELELDDSALRERLFSDIGKNLLLVSLEAGVICQIGRAHV